MNSFETLPGRIVTRTTSSGFPPLWDAPTALCKHPNGMGGVPAWLVCKNRVAIESKCKLSHRRATLIWKKPEPGRCSAFFRVLEALI